MKPQKIGIPLVLLMCLSGVANASVITSFADPALAGAIIDDFESYAEGVVPMPFAGNPAFTIATNNRFPFPTEIGNDLRNVPLGGADQNLVIHDGLGVTITFTQAVSAFAVLIGGADFNWTIEARNSGGGSLGQATATSPNVNGFVFGWAGNGIKTIVLSPASGDPVLLENLHYVVAPVAAVPLPAGGLLLLPGLGAIRWLRRHAPQRT
jgi:hypothetical protein